MGKTIVIAGLVLIVIFGTMAWGFQEQFLFYPVKLPSGYQYRFDQPFEEWMVETEPGVKINALLFTVDQPLGVVLYFHGNAGALNEWGYVAGDFTKRKYDILVVDYRGYGKSTGEIQSEEDFHHDAQVIYDRLKLRYPESQIIIYGRSLGTGVATKLARGKPVKALALETPFYSLESLVKHFVPVLPVNIILKYKFPVYQWLPEVKCPVYAIHGTDDEIIPYDHAIRLTSVASVELTTVKGGNHNNLSLFPEYQQFLDKVLKSQ